jgi:predicted metal-binding membrane protein
MPSERAFLGVSAGLFAVSTAATILWCGSACSGCETEMPGGWMLSMTWTREVGQTWVGAATSFLGMWSLMMVAMMLPSLVPMLGRYRRAVDRTGAEPLGKLTTIVGLGYFAVWTALGAILYPLGVALAAIATQHSDVARAVPLAAGIVVLLAGALQLSGWKARHLDCCRTAPNNSKDMPADELTAWRHGLRLGIHCSYCCLSLMAVLLVLGVMDLAAMSVMTAAITAERFAPARKLHVARAIGVVLVGGGLLLIARAVGLG